MDENEWLASGHPGELLNHVQDRVTWRKQRLFGCACVRLVWHHLADQRFRALVESSEDYADGRITVDELLLAAGPLALVRNTLSVSFSQILTEPSLSAMAAAVAVGQRTISTHLDLVLKLTCSSSAPCPPRQGSEELSRPYPEARQAHQRRAADLLRDIAGNPFRPAALHADWIAWDGGTVGRLAETIYQERRYQDLPVLADALEEAGCDDADVLGHLRGGGVHARGCWVLDLARGA